VAARFGSIRDADPSKPLSQALVEASNGLVEDPPRYTDAEIAERLDARRFVTIRETPGGPAPVETARGLARAREALAADEAWWTRVRSAIADADARLDARSAAL
jgi:hypothetical protein